MLAPMRSLSSRPPIGRKPAYEVKRPADGSSAGLDGVAVPEREAGPKGFACYRRVQVCDLHSTASTQPFIFSELPDTLPEPLYVLSASGSVISPL